MKRNKIITTIGWASVLTSIPWVIATSVLITKFRDQKQVAIQSKPEKERLKTKNKRLDDKIKKFDDKIKVLEVEEQISTKTINRLKEEKAQQKILHNGWYVEESQAEISKLDLEIIKLNEEKEELTAHNASSSTNIIELQNNLIKLGKELVMIHKISPELKTEIANINMAQSILDKLVTITTKETTKSPLEVTYENLDDFIAKTNLTFTKEEKEKLSKVSIKVEVKNDDDFQTVTLKINKKDKTITKSTIKVTGFKTKIEK